VVITGATIGRCAVVTADHEEGIVSQHVGLIRVDQSRVLPRFALLSLMAPKWGGGQLRGQQYGQGMPGLNLSNLRQIPVPRATLGDQEAAVARVAAVREAAAVASARCRASRLAIGAIMNSWLLANLAA
jgi:type I restriction enzyme, S subunit